MPITIIGSNDKKIIVITENKINNKFKDIKLEYELLQKKYFNKCNSNIIDKKCYKHFLKQLTYLFTKTNNIDKLVIYINTRNNNTNLYKQFKIIMKELDILYFLHNSINILKKKLNIPINNKNNFIYNIEYIINKVLSIKNKNEREPIYNIADNIKKILVKLQNENNRLKIINIKKINKDLFLSDKLSSTFMNNIKESLDNIIKTNNIINDNISIYIELINELIQNLTDLHSLC